MNRKTAGLYSAAFAAITIAAYLPYLLLGKSFVFDSDAIHQHVNALMYLGTWLRGIVRSIFSEGGLAIPLWDFTIGYGSDILTTMHYYAFGDPLNLLSVFVPKRYTEFLYDALIIIRLYLAGIAFMLFCHKMKAPRSSLIISALTYVFCGWAVYASMRHAYFLNPLIYLPLMLLGFEKIFRNESPALFMVATFLAAVSNFYFFYMLALAVVFYALVRFFGYGRDRGARGFLKLFVISLGAGIVGALMAGVILVPVVTLFLNTDRAHVELLHDAFYSLSYYLQFLPSFTSSMLTDNWSVIGFAPVTLFAIVLLLSTGGNTALKVSFIILTVFLLIPNAGSVLNGFSYPTNRWVWAYAFFVSFIVAKEWQGVASILDARAALRCLCAILVFVTVTVVLLFPLSDLTFPGLSAKAVQDRRIGVLGSCGLVLIFAATVMYFATRKQSRHGKVSVAYPTILVAVTIAGLILNSWGTSYLTGHVKEHIKSGTVYSKIMNFPATDIAPIQKTEKDFSRFENQSANIHNVADIAGARGINYYWSLGPSGISNYYESLGMSERKTAYSYTRLENRAPLYALASVKYYVGNPGTEPYGFKEIKSSVKHAKKGMALFENENVLPLGYTYRSYLPQEEYDALPMLQRQEALLHGAVIPNEAVGIVSTECPEAQWKPTDELIESSLESLDASISSSSGKTVIETEADATVLLKFGGIPTAEYYVSLKDFYADRKVDPNVGHWGLSTSRTDIKFKSANRTSTLITSTPYYRWTTGQRDYLVSLGYAADGLNEIEIQLPGNTIYSMDSIEVYCQPVGDYASLISELKANHMENELIGVNTVSGTLSLSESKILCLSIPYSSGWRAELDGQPQDLEPVNIMFMGFMVQPGEHQITLYYETPGLRTGIAASILGWLVFIAVVVCGQRKRRRRS